ncbi:MAG: transporter [Acidimicrobiales bacterium]|nr:transporter [Acidimicrobiales bacterium]
MTEPSADGEQAVADPPPPVLRAEGITVRYGGIAALSDVSFDLDAGSCRGLIGPNGAGKTTLFDVLSGMCSTSSGTVTLLGHDIGRRSSAWRARHGMRRTFQRQQIFGQLSVEANVLVALEWQGGGGGIAADMLRAPSRRRREVERLARADEVIELCGLGPLRSQLAGRLPIGQARMVEMARAIVDDPKVLLLDEPTSGLDPAEVERCAGLLRSMRAAGCAIALVEHDIGFVMRECDRIMVLEVGQVIADGPPDTIANDPRVSAAYLG